MTCVLLVLFCWHQYQTDVALGSWASLCDSAPLGLGWGCHHPTEGLSWHLRALPGPHPEGCPCAPIICCPELCIPLEALSPPGLPQTPNLLGLNTRACSIRALGAKPGDLGEMWQLPDLGKMHWKYPKGLDSKCSRNEVLGVLFSSNRGSVFHPFCCFLAEVLLLLYVEVKVSACLVPEIQAIFLEILNFQDKAPVPRFPFRQMARENAESFLQ